jgi:hypothetical protein
MINAKWTKTLSTIICNEKEAGWKQKLFIIGVGLELWKCLLEFFETWICMNSKG